MIYGLWAIDINELSGFLSENLFTFFCFSTGVCHQLQSMQNLEYTVPKKGVYLLRLFCHRVAVLVKCAHFWGNPVSVLHVLEYS